MDLIIIKTTMDFIKQHLRRKKGKNAKKNQNDDTD